MSTLNKTNLVIVSAPIPGDFEGTPQELAEAMIERMEIQSPVGTNFFIVGDVEPNSDQGPWLKNGDRWYVFSDTAGGYVPINVDDSVNLFAVQAAEPDAPAGTDPLLWLRTSGTRAIGWYGWDGTIWRSFTGIPPAGPTTDRPTTPVDLEPFWDTTINALVHYERGAWRTVSGSPGDIKHVALSTLASALQFNPGWEYLGQDDQSIRGLVIGIATKDPGATPDAAFSTDTGITERASGDKTGEETHLLTDEEIIQHTHLMGHSTLLNSDNNIQLHRADDAETLAIPSPGPYNYFEVKGEGTTNGTKVGTAGNGSAGTMLVTTKQLSKTNASATNYNEDAVAHNNMQPTCFFWTLVKL